MEEYDDDDDENGDDIKPSFVAKLAIPVRPITGPWGSSSLRFPEFVDSRRMNVARLSALSRLCPTPHPHPEAINLLLISIGGRVLSEGFSQ